MPPPLDRRAFLLTTTGAAAALALPGARVFGAEPAPSPSPRQDLLLDKGWRFHEGDIPFPEILTQDGSYDNAKAGKASGAAAAGYDDSEWPTVTLPHDFVSFQPIEPNANRAQGYRRRGLAWYRNTLRFAPEDEGKHIELEIGAAATFATVWFNGTIVARNFSGYNAIRIDLTPFARYGENANSLAIRVDAQAMEGWWYEGGGLYRDVRILKRQAVHIATDGVYANPVKGERGWTVPVEVTVASIAAADRPVTVMTELRDPAGVVVAAQSVGLAVPALDSAVARLTLDVAAPRLWSIAAPALYTVRTRLMDGEACLDEVATPCGFRTIRFDAARGLLLNDAPVKVQGVCLHQDHAGVGVAIPDAIWAFRIRRLKELGCNAIRCSHNAPSPVLLDLCDRYGLLVMDENRQFNPTPEYMAQLEWMVQRDRNHPSVFLWSVFNEEPMQGSAAGREMVRRMVHAVKALDRTRPVTAAMNSGYFEPANVSQAVDVVGFNYNHQSYDAFHAAHPDLPMISSEDTSAFMTRGDYASDPGRHVLDSYDDQIGIDTHRAAWRAIAERDFVAGGFVWTGFDYHGEPSPSGWPTNSSQFGIMDLCGFDKAAFYIHQAQWVKDRPVLWLVPHWNWAGREGQPIKVMAMSNLDEVEVRLNGMSQGRQRVDPFEMNSWSVAYAPGTLEAVGYRAGAVAARTRVQTTGEAAALKVTSDRVRARGDGRDAVAFRIEAADAQGRPHPLAKPLARFAVEGGEIIGLGNGDPNCLDPEKGDRRALYNGLAQVIVRPREGFSGDLVLTASAEGLRPGRGVVRVVAAAPPPRQAAGPSFMLLDWWYQAPATPRYEDALAKRHDNLLQWPDFGGRGLLDPLPADGYCLCSAQFTPHARMQAQGGVVDFFRVVGACEVFDGDDLIARKSEPAEGPLTAALPPKPGPRRLNVVFHVVAGQPFGFRKDVTVKLRPGDQR
ncbi:beta-galactosidase GalA [Caulobacter sp. LARHSG274]